MKYCISCGSKNSDGARFCFNCGNQGFREDTSVTALPGRESSGENVNKSTAGKDNGPGLWRLGRSSRQDSASELERKLTEAAENAVETAQRGSVDVVRNSGMSSASDNAKTEIKKSANDIEEAMQEAVNELQKAGHTSKNTDRDDGKKDAGQLFPWSKHLYDDIDADDLVTFDDYEPFNGSEKIEDAPADNKSQDDELYPWTQELYAAVAARKAKAGNENDNTEPGVTENVQEQAENIAEQAENTAEILEAINSGE